MKRNYSDHDLDALKHSLEFAIKFCVPRMSDAVKKHLVGVFIGFVKSSHPMRDVCHECLGTGYFKNTERQNDN